MRSNPYSLKQLIGAGANSMSDEELERFLSIAYLMMNQTFDGSEGYSDTVLAEMECWLAAHLLSNSRLRQAVSEKVGDVTISYGSLGEGLDSTSYGRVVKAMDVSGKLSKTGKRVVNIKAIEENYDN